MSASSLKNMSQLFDNHSAIWNSIKTAIEISSFLLANGDSSIFWWPDFNSEPWTMGKVRQCNHYYHRQTSFELSSFILYAAFWKVQYLCSVKFTTQPYGRKCEKWFIFSNSRFAMFHTGLLALISLAFKDVLSGKMFRKMGLFPSPGGPRKVLNLSVCVYSDTSANEDSFGITFVSRNVISRRFL